MSFTPQNYVDQVGPPVSAAWLNGIDQLAYNALQGAITVPALQAILGITPGLSTPVDISVGGTGATTAATALANLGGTTLAAAVAASVASPVATAGELFVGFTTAQLFTQYPVGHTLRYGILPNNVSLASANTALLRKLCSYGLSHTGYTGLLFFNNTTGADVYYFNDITDFRPGFYIDGNWCTINFAKAAPTGNEGDSGFFHALQNFVLVNVNIVVNFPSSIGAGTALYFGARDSESTQFPNTFDSLWLAATGAPMGNIHLRNVTITSNAPNTLCIGMLGGIQNMSWDNVSLNTTGGVGGGFYGEFGWATSQSSRYQRQTSHPHNLSFRNVKVNGIAANQIAFGINGGYQISVDGLNVINSSMVCTFGTGEAIFFNPWSGVDDGPVSQRTVTVRNAVGKGITGAAFSFNGSSPTQANGVGIGYLGWTPGRAQTVGDYQFNRSGIYICTQNGTTQVGGSFTGSIAGNTLTVPGAVTGSPIAIGNLLSGAGIPAFVTITAGAGTTWTISGSALTVASEAMTTVQGPTGTGTGIVDGTCKWDYVRAAYPAQVDLMTFVLDGFLANQTPAGQNYGIVSTGGRVDVRSGRLNNFSRGVNLTSECTAFNFDSVDILNSTGIGMNIGGGFNIYPTTRKGVGSVKNCFIAGSGADGVTAGPAVNVSNVLNLKIEHNRFGYNLAHDNVAETTQVQAVLLGANVSNVICDDNAVSGVASGPAFSTSGFTSSQGCLVSNTNFDATVTTQFSGLWENTFNTISADIGDANSTYIAHTRASTQLFATVLTANRTLGLSTTNAGLGDVVAVLRTGLGAFTLDFGGLKTLPAGTAAWARAKFNGTAWVLTEYGTL